MKRVTLTILLALLWLVVAIAYQPLSRSYALPSAPFNSNAVLPSTTAQLTATVGDSPVVTDLTVPQIRVWPLDGSLVSLDGQAPVQNQGISFVAGRFDRAAEFNRDANSMLAYRATGNVDPNEGSLALWIGPTYDLTDAAYRDHSPLFSYAIDRDNQLSVEIDDGCVTLSQRNQGRLFSGTCQQVPDWRAGEWHHLAVTWSGSANRIAVYYDCSQTAVGDYRALSGIANTFHLGSDAEGRTIDAALDDVRLSRRALTANEVAAVCRDRPVPHDRIISPSAPTEPVPLGQLQPITGLLPYGTILFTLSLTTTAQADCRWSEITSTLYVSMPHSFQAGQGSVSHSTPINTLTELADRRFYVRCRDAATGRDPDNVEQQTHVRLLGPWSNRYPRLANLWNDFTTNPGAAFLAGFDLHVVFGGSKQASQAPYIRAANPNAKVLLTAHATYGVPGIDSPATEWWYSQPGDPDYNCLLRNTQGTILLVAYWNHPMYNMTVPYCRTILARLSIDDYLSLDQNWGADLAYDGLYWDRLHDTIDWLGSDIDSNLDGLPDTPDDLNAAYQAGVKDFLTQVRARLPHAVLMGNDAALIYAPWINGRNFETQVAGLLDGAPITWTGVTQDYRAWADSGITPRTTFIASSPELFYSSKFTYLHTDQMPPAMRAEAAASYSRMRYGLVLALLGDGLFSYDYGPDGHGDRWWYDEYGVSGGSGSSLPPTNTLPPRGYLGQPGSTSIRLEGVLHSTDQVINGSFNDGLNNWIGWVDPNSGAVARFKVSETGGLGGTTAASIAISETSGADNVELRQLNKSTVANHQYTVSFWGRSTQVSHPIDIQLIVDPTPWVGTGFHVQATLTPQWQLFRLTDVSVRTRSDLRLVFQLGSETGKIWLDDIQFQEGEAGAWARSFENGLAVINPSSVAQTVLLPGIYRKLNGSQAPLFQARLDDDDLLVNGNWVKSSASFSQFGNTVYTLAAPDPLATITYQPNLFYDGIYQVLAWVVPTATQSSTVDITIHHADGETTVTLDETQGEIGWRDLGTYRFGAGTNDRVVLSATGTGLVVADAVKWVSTARYNDGQAVRQVILQPQDAIILQRVYDIFLPVLLR